ncbi:MAG TPA: biotin synthase BioB [Tepidisphaeraceae bacterium]|nr:biotin synthase BioB [Tepidisphaeraceae bacterium]
MSIEIQDDLIAQSGLRYDWTRQEIGAIFDMPLMELVYRAASVHRQFHDPGEVQVCRLISIKTGGCPEDCKYCSQSAHYKTEISAQPLMEKCRVMEIATKAKASGVTRLCMGAAWRQVKDGEQFDTVLEMVKSITELGLEVCCTLGMLTETQARQLEEAGLYAYNHNIDTSPEYYETIITTRTFADRLKTLENVRKTDITVCCGGILGLGETKEDRISMLHALATMNPHPESVPINILSKVPGTPLEKSRDVPVWETVRVIATARIVMPDSMVRLSAGRSDMSVSDQALCFMAGANSIFSSDERIMLTKAAASQDYDQDKAMLDVLGLNRRRPFKRTLNSER